MGDILGRFGARHGQVLPKAGELVLILNPIPQRCAALINENNPPLRSLSLSLSFPRGVLI